MTMILANVVYIHINDKTHPDAMWINLPIGPEESPPWLGSSAKNQQNWFLDSSVGESGAFSTRGHLG